MADKPPQDCPNVGPIRACVQDTVDNYFAQLDGHSCCDLYRMVIEQAEAPLFEVVMRECSGNQTRAAAALGINRGTLRKKLRQYGLED
ncbi:MAG: DNA-binding transcriptional regulator Fis [Spiribacter sp.]|jgi:Fis family transcriptional regulator|nr:DNA-binding transcriptional regulator Fis [Spiribacter sp.]MDR9489826.1 DNA-binding transcriptional regulator Fis [Spiribacter sp.]